MKSLSLGLFVAGFVAVAFSLFMPTNRDWLGFFWAAFALEIVLRGPGAADYPLFLLVTVGNALTILAPLAFAGARNWGRIVAHLLVLATAGSVYASLRYRPATWSMGFYVWCAALAVMATGIYFGAVRPAPRVASVPAGAKPRALGALRRTRAR